ncbi:MAG: hypothetical protein ACREF3_08870, partial [Acetobacteraceae bacterium]
PGTYLIMKVLAEFHDSSSGVDRIDFGAGDGEYKLRFGNKSEMVSNVHFFAVTPPALWTNLSRTAVGLGSKAGKHVLERAGVAVRIKRALRQRRVPRLD